MGNNRYELIILGAGPAGMTAAVYAARKRVKALLLSKDVGGQVLWTMGIENYMGYQYITGPELIAKFEEQVRQHPIDQHIGHYATSLQRVGDGFEVTEEDSSVHHARAVIVATGKRPRQMGVPGEGMFRGRGVSYCAICDAPIFSGQPVAVVGGGNSGLEAALDLAKVGATHLYLVTIGDLTGDPVLIEQVRALPNITIYAHHKVLEVTGDALVQGIRIAPAAGGEAKALEVGGVFVEIGLVPNSEIAKGLARLNQWGEIVVTPACETDVPGLFAAGDVTDVPEKQIVVAAGEGSKAAIQAHRYLTRLAEAKGVR